MMKYLFSHLASDCLKIKKSKKFYFYTFSCIFLVEISLLMFYFDFRSQHQNLWRSISYEITKINQYIIKIYFLYHIKPIHDVKKSRILKIYFPSLSLTMADKRKEDKKIKYLKNGKRYWDNFLESQFQVHEVLLKESSFFA